MFKVYNSLSDKLEVLDLALDKPIKWYTCGPTIYDSAHLGHARTFISFDIIRRVLINFGYGINYVMNITDIDDKILNSVGEIFKEHAGQNDYKTTYYNFIQEKEKTFWSDMDKLNILRPTIVTRVTEYIPKMIDYVQKILDNGYAYEANGSIYFDSKAFEEKHVCNKFFKRLSDLKETEYTDCEFAVEKKNKMDFSLWKKAKEGELSFETPWSSAMRPGWSLECSVMASDILHEGLDIHSGGIDLLFPHHTNELLQATAFNDKPDFRWVKFFLHSGHLHIDGKKMSQSLKNYITIQEFLEKMGEPNDLRMLSLMHHWNSTMNYTQDNLSTAKNNNKRFVEFIKHLQFILRNKKNKNKISKEDEQFNVFFFNLRKAIHNNLLENINTPEVIKNLFELMNRTYVYLEFDYNYGQINQVYTYFLQIVELFGLSYKLENNSTDVSKYVDVLVDFREEVRKVVRSEGHKMNKEAANKLYDLLDDLRNNKMKSLGIEVQDGNKGCKWIFMSK